VLGVAVVKNSLKFHIPCPVKYFAEISEADLTGAHSEIRIQKRLLYL
jgi:hypothetical protein